MKLANILRGIVSDDKFPVLLAAATELRSRFADGSPFYAHLNAMVLGMTNLQSDTATMAQALTPPPALPTPTAPEA